MFNLLFLIAYLPFQSYHVQTFELMLTCLLIWTCTVTLAIEIFSLSLIKNNLSFTLVLGYVFILLVYYIYRNKLFQILINQEP